jgi:hypothetical protein
MPPREWTQIIAAEEDPAMGKSKVAGNGTNKMGELLGVLSPVATELVHLAGARFNMQNGFVVLRLVRCGSDRRRAPADCDSGNLFVSALVCCGFIQFASLRRLHVPNRYQVRKSM